MLRNDGGEGRAKLRSDLCLVADAPALCEFEESRYWQRVPMLPVRACHGVPCYGLWEQFAVGARYAVCRILLRASVASPQRYRIARGIENEA